MGFFMSAVQTNYAKLNKKGLVKVFGEINGEYNLNLDRVKTNTPIKKGFHIDKTIGYKGQSDYNETTLWVKPKHLSRFFKEDFLPLLHLVYPETRIPILIFRLHNYFYNLRGWQFLPTETVYYGLFIQYRINENKKINILLNPNENRIKVWVSDFSFEQVFDFSETERMFECLNNLVI